MAKSRDMEIKKGIINNPRYSNEIVTINKNGVMTLNKNLKSNVKRPDQYK